MFFLTADTHFSHGIIILHCSRIPWIIHNPNYDHNILYDFVRNNNYSVNLQKHDEDLKTNWNNIVGKNDQVIIAGDFAYRNHKYHINSLNGKKTLVKGNHDKSNGDFYNTFTNDNSTPDLSDIRKECSSALKRFKNDDIDINECSDYILTAAWAKFMQLNDYGSIDIMSKDCYRNFLEVYDMGCRKNIEGKDITICHYAMRSWASSCHGSYLFYGHSHGRMPEFKNVLSCDVGVDVWGYAPVPIEALFKKMKIKEESIKDNKYFDGENERNNFSENFKDRINKIRNDNKEIMKSLGYPIIEEMWQNS